MALDQSQLVRVLSSLPKSSSLPAYQVVKENSQTLDFTVPPIPTPNPKSEGNFCLICTLGAFQPTSNGAFSAQQVTSYPQKYMLSFNMPQSYTP